jgi:hypothetical protein
MDRLPSSVLSALDAVEASLAQLEGAQEADDSHSTGGALDGANRNIAMALALNGMYLMLMRANGEDAEKHPAKEDYERSLRAFARIQEAATKRATSRGAGKHEQQPAAAALGVPDDADAAPAAAAPTKGAKKAKASAETDAPAAPSESATKAKKRKRT